MFYDGESIFRRIILMRLILGGGGVDSTVTGVSPLSLVNAISRSIKRLTQYGKLSVSGSTITCNNGVLKVVNNEIVADGTPEEIVVQGRNLLPNPVVGSYSLYGITATVSEDGIIAVTGKKNIDSGMNLYVPLEKAYTPPSGCYYHLRNSNSTGSITVGLGAGSPALSPMNRIWLAGTPNETSQINIYLASSVTEELSFTFQPSVEMTSDVTDFVPYFHETATAENLFAVDDIVDEQDIITGKVIRRTEAVVSDGTTPSGRYVGEVGEGNIIVKVREIGYTGEVVSFTTEEETPLTGLRVNFEPIQDLHGYDNPWPAGGGKNKFNPADLRSGKSIYGNDSIGSAPTLYNSAASKVYVNASYLEAGQTYTISYRNVGAIASENSRTGYLCDANGLIVEKLDVTWIANANSVLIAPTVSGWLWATFDNSTTDIQLESGSEATSFAPFSNLCPISGHTSADVTRTGKNLFDKDTLSEASEYDNLASGYRYCDPIVLKPNTQYTINPTSTQGLGVTDYYVLYINPDESDPDYLVITNPSVRYVVTAGIPQQITFTTGQTGVIRFGVVMQGSGIKTTALEAFMSVNYQLELGSTATAYEPYVGTTYPIPLGTTVYGGTLDVLTGVLTVNKAYDLLNDPDKSSVFTGGNVDYIYSTSFSRKIYQDSYTGLMCTAVPTKSIGNLYGRWRGADSMLFGIRDIQVVLTLAKIQEMAENNQIAICYDIEPQTIQLTAQQVELLLGENNIWSDGKSVNVYVSDGELIVQVTPQKLKTAEGTNTVTVTAEVSPIQLSVVYIAKSE